MNTRSWHCGRCLLSSLAAAIFMAGAALAQVEPPASEAPAFVSPAPEILDTRFAELLSGAALVGHFTIAGGNDDDDAPLRTEKYTLTEVRKLRGSLWLFQTRVEYGDHDVTLPITLPVEWAGDVPVIIVDNVGFPGLGTYSARVAFHGDRYFGTWQGANHGGHMFGTIERAEVEEEQKVEE